MIYKRKTNFRKSKDEDLLRLLEEAPVKGFSDLYDCYAAPVYGLILNKVENKEQANEVLYYVFYEFKKQFAQAGGIEEGIFISLYKITLKLISFHTTNSKV
ncbi:MAG TPA: hypothetical protein VF623_15710 [Segetibacter sp.]|jgi:hypothetical protein